MTRKVQPASTSSKASENDFSGTTVKMFNELREMMTQVVHKAQESMRAEMRKLESEMTEMKSMIGVYKTQYKVSTAS